MPASNEAITEALLIVGFAAVVALAGGSWHCYEYSQCSAAHTCANTNSYSGLQLGCSFTNFP
jgi:hypothetical protein